MQDTGNKPLQLAVIYGSARQGRLCDQVVGWVTQHIEKLSGFEVRTIDPRDFGPALSGQDTDQHAQLRAEIAAADAYLVVTPEYNHGYPADLKLLIDSAYKQWQAKAVAFVSYGGLSGGIRAVEQLRQVFAELHVVGLRDSVSFPMVWKMFGVEPRPDLSQQAEALSLTLRRLHWWASTLKNARSERPYDQTA